MLGLAWIDRSPAPTGYYTRKMAEDALGTILAKAREGSLPESQALIGDLRRGLRRVRALRRVEKGRKPSTLVGYRSVNRALVAELGDATPLAAITTERIGRIARGS